MTQENLSLENRRRRLRFRGWHRGIKEMDIIFGNFLDQHADNMSHKDCQWFEELFEENDHEILAWVTGGNPVPAKYQCNWMNLMQELNFLKLRS